MKVSFLGTNGWYTTPTGNTPCIVIDTRDQYIVLDAGNGIYKLDEYIKEDKPIFLFISHFHIDHTSGLHTLSKFNFKQGIDVYVGPNRSKDFQILVNPPYTVGYLPRPDNVGELRTPIRLNELSEEGKGIPFQASAIPQSHAYKDHGYRFVIDGKTVAYTGDCGPTEATIKLARDADLLITECAHRKTPTDNTWGHLDPVLAATIAKKANVKQLILTHFDASQYTTLNDRKEAEEKAREIFSQTIAATDGFEFIL